MSVVQAKGWCPVCHRPIECTLRGARIGRHNNTIGKRCWDGSGLPFRVAIPDSKSPPIPQRRC